MTAHLSKGLSLLPLVKKYKFKAVEIEQPASHRYSLRGGGL
jgi:hypothetical protein